MNYAQFTRQLSSVAIVTVAFFSWTASSASANAVGGVAMSPSICTQGFKAGPKDSKGNYKCTSNRTACGSNQSAYIPKYVVSTQKFEYTCAYPVKSGTGPRGLNNVRKK